MFKSNLSENAKKRINILKDSNDGFGLRKFNYASGNEFYTYVKKEPRVREDF